MGYRFTLETANIVANLSFGNVLECYEEVFCSNSAELCNFLDFLEQFSQNMITEDPELYYSRVERLLRKLMANEDDYILYENNHQKHIMEMFDRMDPMQQSRRVQQIYTELERKISASHNSENGNSGIWKDNVNYGILEDLKELSLVFERCTLKALLLPPLRHHKSERNTEEELLWRNHQYDEYEFMTSPHTLRELVKFHPGDSCLILQPHEQTYTATVFNAFPHFDVALRQADLWPAVLFWEGQDDYAFIPIKNEAELIDLFRLAKYDSHPIHVLKRIAEGRKQTSQVILQLSDLHFGADDVIGPARRLKSLVRTQLEKIDSSNRICTIITGDGVDSPKESAEDLLTDFSEYIKAITKQEPIRVLGNHDINFQGLAISHSTQNIANNLCDFPRLEYVEGAKTILLLFNSNNTGADLAKGEIGVEQMIKMGNLLDEVKNLSDYLLIAVLHHHVVPIPTPEYYERKWYSRIIPSRLIEESLKLIDADEFLDWLQKRNVRLVLHGHKHIPYFTVTNGIAFLACGSSTGKIRSKEKGKTCLSLNWITINSNSITLTQVSEERLGAGPDIRTDIINL